MATTGGVLGRLKQPEYTGENRCMPCTVVNTGIAVVLSAVVAAVGTSSLTPLASVGAGAAVFVLSLAAIYLRGYLVPGTPTITKRYFPDWLLRAFGKEPEAGATRDITTDLDPEAVLTGIGALTECADGEDLCLTDAFREEWHGELDRVGTDPGREELLGLLDIDKGKVEYEEYGSAFTAAVDGDLVGKWESQAAFVADLAGANALADRHPGWERLPMEAKSQLLSGLRLFVDTCPACGGTPTFGTETVESCCSTHEVAAVSCDDCGARLFESEPI